MCDVSEHNELFMQVIISQKYPKNYLLFDTSALDCFYLVHFIEYH